METPYTRTQCQGTGGHFIVGGGFNGPCARCGINGGGSPGRPEDLDKFTRVERLEDVPDPLELFDDR